ncbi:XylR family transcriptional regulator [Pirellulaceae bacterium SH449]
MSSRAVALLIEMSSGYCRGLLEGIHAFAKLQGEWSIYLNEQERGAPPPPWLADWKGDGIIARIETDQVGASLKQLQIPIVDLSAARRIQGIPWADTDDEAIAQLAIDHFLDRGFANVAFCGEAGYAWSNSRRQYFRSFAEDAGCKYFEHQLVHRYDPSFQWDKVQNELSVWIRSLPVPTAVMTCNDYLGKHLLDLCRSLHISVPEEVAVLGVDDDHLLYSLCTPSLSSIEPNTYRTGFEAAELLQRMMDKEQVDRSTRLVTKPLGVKIRESTDTMAIPDQEITKALIYIRRNALRGIQVCDVLKVTPISRRSLEHRFMKHIGHSPHEEIMRIRLTRIKELLTETDDSIHQIAQRTGFSHPEYMTAAFKKEIGMTPSQYRESKSERSD